MSKSDFLVLIKANYARCLLFIFVMNSCVGFALSSIPEKPADWDEWIFNQKISWRGQHLDPRIPYASLVDKLKVKAIVGKNLLTAKTLFSTDNPRLIVLKALPKNYIMKANNASGRGLLVKEGLILASRKRDIDFIPIKATKKILRSYAKEWLETPYSPSTEMQYALMKPMIIFEEYLENLTMDIELFCFNGKVGLIEILFIDDYKKMPVISFYDANWNLLEATHPDLEVKNERIDKPEWLDELIRFVGRFTRNIDHVRVDFYFNGKDVYFGEFTFTTGGNVVPEKFQKMLGSYWEFPGVEN